MCYMVGPGNISHVLIHHKEDSLWANMLASVCHSHGNGKDRREGRETHESVQA